MLLVRYLGEYFPKEIEAKYVYCGTTGITAYDANDEEIAEITYDILISIRAK